jgi:predicted nucleotidyltransferase
MNEASQQRIERARPVAGVYASHPDVQAIILGGSTARGVASADSEIDLGLCGRKLPLSKSGAI